MSDSSEELWNEHGREYGWVMPRAPWWKRTLIVRRIRYAWIRYRVERWANAWGAAGIGNGQIRAYDRWVLYGIATGKERPMSGE